MSAQEAAAGNRALALPQEKRLGELLIENGLLTHEELSSALAQQKKERRPLGQLLLASSKRRRWRRYSACSSACRRSTSTERG